MPTYAWPEYATSKKALVDRVHQLRGEGYVIRSRNLRGRETPHGRWATCYQLVRGPEQETTSR